MTNDKFYVYTVKVPEKLHKQVQQFLRETGMTKSEFIRASMRAYIKEHRCVTHL